MMTLEPDGTAAACKAVFEWVRLPPASLRSKQMDIQASLNVVRPAAHESSDRSRPSVSRTWTLITTTFRRLAQWKEHQTANLAVAGSTPVPLPQGNLPVAPR